jgi:hypothetical protein
MSWARLADPKSRPLPEINRPDPPLFEHAVIYAPRPAEHVSKLIAKIGERKKRFKGFIPNVVWAIIMTMLVADDLISISKVSRQLHRIAALPECWQGRALMLLPRHGLVANPPTAKDRRIAFVEIERILRLDPHTNCNFTTMFIDGTLFAGNEQCNIIRFSPRLRNLSLRMRFETSIFEQLQQTRLETLYLDRCYSENALDMPTYREAFLAQADSLKSLHISASNNHSSSTMFILEALGDVLDRFNLLEDLKIMLAIIGGASYTPDRDQIVRVLTGLGRALTANTNIMKLEIRSQTRVTESEMTLLLANIVKHPSIRTLLLGVNLTISAIRDLFAGSNISEVILYKLTEEIPPQAMTSDKPKWTCLRKLQLKLFDDSVGLLFKEAWMPNIEELLLGSIENWSSSWHCNEFSLLLENLKGYPKLRRLDLAGIELPYKTEDNYLNPEDVDDFAYPTGKAYVQYYRAAFGSAMRLLAALPDLVITSYPDSEYWHRACDKDNYLYYGEYWDAYSLEELHKIATEYGVDISRLNSMIMR